jgi:hypothetical protein
VAGNPYPSLFLVRCIYQISIDWLIDWLMFNLKRAIFQLYSGREHVYNKSICRLKTGDG